MFNRSLLTFIIEETSTADELDLSTVNSRPAPAILPVTPAPQRVSLVLSRSSSAAVATPARTVVAESGGGAARPSQTVPPPKKARMSTDTHATNRTGFTPNQLVAVSSAIRQSSGSLTSTTSQTSQRRSSLDAAITAGARAVNGTTSDNSFMQLYLMQSQREYEQRKEDREREERRREDDLRREERAEERRNQLQQQNMLMMMALFRGGNPAFNAAVPERQNENN